ncbi:FxDxF family PEP-CTERM protein [Methylobacillus gramineus]|uniref:FxDxF family PEP-CTERM protein n=1 Tax=Methylobacillus gramineus TaxID=755169 RepID=UPI001CFFCF94|nr:FxDxF family PEP-CTERM protein [Methylobacillus gramineus]MCB5186051.1 FxDxF family PEP-CTERM protein [Methylobacillus gramineus]
MKFLKSLLVSVAFIAAASSANAANYNWGVLSDGDSYEEYTVSAGDFLDTITFTIGQESVADFGAGVLNVVVGKKQFQFIENLAVSLFDVEDNQLGSGLNFTVDTLTAGTYTLKITGFAKGTLAEAGKYGVGVTIAAVPEPSSVAMLLVGFAALGAVARRRKTL